MHYSHGAICSLFQVVYITATRPAEGALSLRQAEQCWKEGADPIEFAKEHKEFARAFESFEHDADALFPGWRDKLGVHK